MAVESFLKALPVLGIIPCLTTIWKHRKDDTKTQVVKEEALKMIPVIGPCCAWYQRKKNIKKMEKDMKEHESFKSFFGNEIKDLL